MEGTPAACSNETALDKRKYFVGILPQRLDTMVALVLADLLGGHNPVTASTAFKKHGAKSLSKIISVIEIEYGWAVERTQVAELTPEGHVVSVTGYALPKAMLEEVRKPYEDFSTNVKLMAFYKARALNQRKVLKFRSFLRWERGHVDSEDERMIEMFASLLDAE